VSSADADSELRCRRTEAWSGNARVCVKRHVDLGKELFDGHRSMCRAGGPEDVESVLRERQLGVDDGLAADLTQSRRKATGLFDRDQR
jgi:hypothetical protein